ncbi:uncharacterized protein LOC126899156 [Daktulosphaira vitifoliae]|uniref:uncharacterized protein LOC126899156 n=1 Tax=Daktulosphaira vitifoliae TaxID=58002 RepID=UPI0021AA606A|nr:uncharacterized protein LOC126899156 [Daktulosphaira vitifoliae]
MTTASRVSTIKKKSVSGKELNTSDSSFTSSPPWNKNKLLLNSRAQQSTLLPINSKDIQELFKYQQSLQTSLASELPKNNILSPEVSTRQTSLESSCITSDQTSSDYTASNNPYDNPLVKKLKKASVIQNIRKFTESSSEFYSTDSDSNSFFPLSESSNQESDNIKDGYGCISANDDDKIKYPTYEQRFHWSENIDHRSPWVRHRAKEIWENANELFKFSDLNKKESLLQNIPLDETNINTEFNNDINTSIDENDEIIFKIAEKLCKSLPDYKSTSNQWLKNNDLKWTLMYQKLVKYGLIDN